MGTEIALTTTIHSKAPTRIDLAGGTVDIWPLYLFLNQPVTLNLGIDLFAEATLTYAPASGPGTVTLEARDQDIECSLSWDKIETFSAHPALDLHARLLRHFARVCKPGANLDLKLSTVAKSPAGAGLGGSSALSIAIVGALGTWAYGKPVDPIEDGEKFIEIVRDVETTVIQVPAGLQDYYGAMYGGVQSLRWGFGSHERAWLDEKILSGLDERLLLFYSGRSRNSGINNWALFKDLIDKKGGVWEKFQQIADATRALEQAVVAGNWEKAASAIATEWSVRKTLAAGISTPEMNEAFAEAETITQGKLAGKVCGAGGGGCFFIFLPDPTEQAKRAITSAFEKRGMRHLPFRSVPRGLEITVKA